MYIGTYLTAWEAVGVRGVCESGDDISDEQEKGK